MNSSYHFKFVIGDNVTAKFRFYSQGQEGEFHICTGMPDRARYNPINESDWESQIVGRLNTIYRFWHPTLPFTREFVQSFNGWQMAEHLAEIAQMQAAPEKYGTWEEIEHLCPPPARLRGVVWQDGRYVDI